MQGIPLPNESFTKFNERANLYSNELPNWELNGNEKINNFYFEKFRIAPLATPKFASWWEAMFKKLLSQPPSMLMPKLKQIGASALALDSPPPASKEVDS